MMPWVARTVLPGAPELERQVPNPKVTYPRPRWLWGATASLDAEDRQVGAGVMAEWRSPVALDPVAEVWHGIAFLLRQPSGCS